jgi:hypothetical protein
VTAGAIPINPPRRAVTTGRTANGDFPWRGQGRAAMEARRAQCLEMLAEVDGQLTRITSHIEQARAQGRDRGRDRRSEWWRRVLTARRAQASQRQRLQEELGELRRALGADRSGDRDRMFVRVTRELLGNDRVEEIWLEVTRRLLDAGDTDQSHEANNRKKREDTHERS